MNELHQILTLIRLKSKLTLRSYARDALATVQSLVFAFLIFFFALALGVAVVITFYFLRGHLWEIPGIEVMALANLLWFIYGIWILVPLFGFRLNESYDISKLIPLPIKRTTLFIAAVVGCFADMTIAIPVAATIGIMVLFTISLPTFAFNLLVLVVYLINMILAGQLLIILIYNVFPRISLYKLLLGFIVIITTICYLWFSWQARTERVIHIFDIEVGQKIYIYFPHGMASSAIWHGYFNAWTLAFRDFGWLILHTTVLGTITGFLYSNWYASGHIEGTSVGEGEVGHRSFAGLTAAFWTKLLKPILPTPALEIMRKDHLHFLRNRNFLLQKYLPVIIGPGIVMIATWHSTTHYVGIQNVKYIVGCLINSAMIFSFFIITAQANLFAGNIFGLEGRSIYQVFTTQVNKRQVLMGKNAFLLSLLLFDAVLFGGLTWLVLGSQVPYALAVGFMLFICMLNFFTMLVALGNFVSALFPYHFDIDRPAVTAQHVLLLIIIEAVTVTIAAILLLPSFLLIFLPFWMHVPLLWLLFTPLSLAYSFLWLWLSIRYAGPLVERLERAIMLKVSEP